MSTISLERRGIDELGEVHPRRYGVQLADLSAAVQLNLNHNHLRTLQRPFARPDFTPATASPPPPQPPHPPRTAHDASAAPARAAAATTSLEEESSALRPFTSLAALRVCHNQLRSLTGACGVADTLTVLVATHNALTSLEGLQGCRRLTYIDLSHNAITSLRGLPLTSLATAAAVARASSADGRHRASNSSAPAAAAPAAAPAGGDGGPAAHLTPAALAAAAAAAAAAQDAEGDIEFAVEGEDDVAGARAHPRDGWRAGGGSFSTSSISFSLHTSIAAGGALDHRRRSRGAGTAAATPLLGAVPAARSTTTSVQFEVEDTVSEDARPRLAGPPSSPPPSPLTPHGVAEGGAGGGRAGVVLLLAHNRLRGAALRGLLWANASEEAAGAATAGTATLLRPWATALTHLDLSHNYIEDVRDVRRLVQPVRWPTPPSTPGQPSVWAPPLWRLRRLDVSGNALLVNGSLAEELARPPPTTATTAAPDPHPTSARRSTLAPSHDALAEMSALSVGPALRFQLSDASTSLAAALRTCGGAAGAALTDVTAARAPMQAVLHALGERWSACAPSTAAIGPGAFALFTETVDVAWPAAKAAPCTVQLRGGEVTVLAAALREGGARLSDVLAVPASPPRPSHTPPVQRRAGASPGPSPSAVRRGVHSAAAVQAVFLTPPPPRQRPRATATASTEAVAPQRPPVDHHAATQPSSISIRSSSSGSGSGSHHAAGHAEASAQGYRLYEGRGTAHRPTQPLTTATPVQDAEAATRHDDVAQAALPHPHVHASTTLTTDTVALQLLRAEVGELRRRYRELQRQTRDQACVVQRHEATMREMRAAAAQAVRERQAAQAELATARQEVERLRERLQRATEAPAPTPSTEHA